MSRESLMVALDPSARGTRILVMDGLNEPLRAVLGSAEGTHPRAAATLLEGLALWQQRPLTVALCVNERERSSRQVQTKLENEERRGAAGSEPRQAE